MTRAELRRRRLASAFIIASVASMAWMNLPANLAALADRRVPEAGPAGLGMYWFAVLGASFINVEFFHRPAKTGAWYRFLGRSPGGEDRLLPEPLQDAESAVRRLPYYKEVKFHQRMRHTGREAPYARYLCRRYASASDFPLGSVVFQVWGRRLQGREEARLLSERIYPCGT